MTYTVGSLAKLAGISVRTLRYYDQIGLLKPERILQSGYRIYENAQVDRLQQILFYRELGVDLHMIQRIMNSPDFKRIEALETHLRALTIRKERLSALIDTVKHTISAAKGEIEMTDKEKFTAFKHSMVDENEKKYGSEVRARFGDEAMDATNAKVLNMTQPQYAQAETLTNELNAVILAAFKQGDPKSALAQKACELHKQWLMLYWSHYSPEAHAGLAQMYADDARFTAYYDAIAPGCALFLRDAIVEFCKES